MAIRMMCDAGTPGAVRDDHWSRSGPEIFVKTEHEGMVVSMREINMRDDSDFLATYYDPETDSFKEVTYASTRGWTYPNGAWIDATPEVAAKWEAKLAADRAAAEAAYEARKAATPDRGKRVRLIVGKRANHKKGEAAIPAGTEGEVFWYGEDRFTRSYSYFGKPMRVGVTLDDGRKVFLSAGNVEVVKESA